MSSTSVRLVEDTIEEHSAVNTEEGKGEVGEEKVGNADERFSDETPLKLQIRY